MTAISHPDDGQVGQAGAGLAEHGESGTTAPAAGREWHSSPALQGLLALATYLAVWALTVARPLVRHASSAQLHPKSMDPNFYVWSLRWWPYAIGHGLNPLYSSQIAAPAGHALAWVTTVPPLALLSAPLTLAAGPVVSFNLLMAAALPLCAWAAFVLCRRLTGKFWPSLVGGAVFGFSAYGVTHEGNGQINLTFSLLLPILAYLVVLWRDESISSPTFVLLAGITMAVQFYLFLETFADLTAILAVCLVAGFALAGRSGRPVLIRLGKLFGLAYLITLALAAPYLWYALTTQPPRPIGVTGLDLASLVIPRPGRTLGIAWLGRAALEPNAVSAACYVGVPLLVLAVVLAVTGWSSRLVRFLSCMLVFIMVASLGPAVYLEGHRVVGLPWAALYHLPIVRNAWPSRLMLFAFLALAVGTALWLADPAKRRWARWPLAVLIVAAIGLDAAPISVKARTVLPAFISSGQYRRDLSAGEIVAVVSKVGNAGMLWQAEAGFYMRLAGGFINAGFNHGSDLPEPIQNLAQPTPAYVAQFEAFIKDDHVGAILVDARHEPGWAGIFQRVGLVGHRIGDVVVYKTNGCQSCHPMSSAQLETASGTA